MSVWQFQNLEQDTVIAFLNTHNLDCKETTMLESFEYISIFWQLRTWCWLWRAREPKNEPVKTAPYKNKFRPARLNKCCVTNVQNTKYSHYQQSDHLFSARVPWWSVRRADLIAELIADLNAICAICRSYIGHIWAIHKRCINHVQPLVQATDGTYPIFRKWGAAAKGSRYPFSLYLLSCFILSLIHISEPTRPY